ncbi:MAG: chemotaxis response regulator protein-glutamate methylesterase [Candidatus Riflebacteria bacterium]|nr:chemotaxis response regulator protein-glutamate methylesterase [Candidatus Riflebacteria bacterium]
MTNKMAITNKIRVLIVDDSAFMRAALERMLHEDATIDVIGSAGNGKEGVEKAIRLRPDVITMDIEMPVMDGLHAIREIMRLSPIPIIMVSSITQHGAQATFDALELGAIDYIGKPGSGFSANILTLRDDLLTKIHAAAESSLRMRQPLISRGRTPATENVSIDTHPRGISTFSPKRAIASGDQNTQIDWIVVIGASTGGPSAIQTIISALPPNLPAPVIIAQHMPAVFTGAFAQRLNTVCKLRVKETANGEILQRTVVYICAGDHQTSFKRRDDNRYMFSVTSNELEKARFAPSIDYLFLSAAEIFGRKTMSIILTGMGEDGVRGMKNIKAAGGLTIAQDRASSVVYGMPRAALEQGAVTRILSLSEIPSEIELALR